MTNSIKLYETELQVLLDLPDEERSRILTALICDCLGKDIPELSPLEKGLFVLIQGQVKRAEDLSNKRKQNVNSRWDKNAKPEIEDTTEIQNDTNFKAKDTKDIQNDTTEIQNYTKPETEDTNAYTNTNTNTNTITGDSWCASAKPSPEKIKFQKFGEYLHVKLTPEQHKKLISDFGEAVISEYIRRCDEYQQQTGKSYMDYNLTIRNWIEEDRKKDYAKGKEKMKKNKDAGENRSLDTVKIEQILNDKWKNSV